MHTLKTSIQKVEIGSLADSSLSLLLKERFEKAKKVVLMDENTHRNCWPYLLEHCPLLNQSELVVLPAGEENKTLEIVAQVWETLSAYQIKRNDVLINLGGGVITDLGGFIASTYKRGMEFVNIPTSLLAMVDASVGGKTGCNLGAHKNQIGVFATPVLTICDTAFLSTLPEKEVKSGKAEMIKHGLIASLPLFEKLKKTEDIVISNTLLEETIGIKAKIVEADFKETKERKKLNFGHTIGHAIEGYLLQQEQPKTHGECVAWGMIAASFLSVEKSGLSTQEYQEIRTFLVKKYGFPPLSTIDFPVLLELMKHDKKNEGEEINFTLLSSIGTAVVNSEVKEEEIMNALQEIIP